MKTCTFAILISFCFLLPAMASPDDKTIFNVRGFGAMGDGKQPGQPGHQPGDSAASAAGGGTVFVPAGTYLSGSIHLTNNIHLFLDAGAVILGAPQGHERLRSGEACRGQAYQDGGHTYFHNSLIWGENLTNVSITGPGMINGGGLVRGDELLDRMSGFQQWSPDQPHAADCNESPPVRLGNKAIALKLCRNVLLRDFTIFHGGHFAILVTGCDDLTVDNVTMDTNRDGMDIDCCRNTMVSNCRINSPGDDGLCPKSSYALGRNVITENLTIVNCQVSGFKEGTLLDGTMKPSAAGTGRIKFGTEANGGFRNVHRRQLHVPRLPRTGARGSGRRHHGEHRHQQHDHDGRGRISDLHHHRQTQPRPGCDHAAAGCGTSSSPTSSPPALTAMSGIQITGLPGQPIEGVRLENIRLVFKGGGTKAQAARVPPELGTGYPEPGSGMMPAYGVFARHVRDLELANIRLSFDDGGLAAGDGMCRTWTDWRSTTSRRNSLPACRRQNLIRSKMLSSGTRRCWREFPLADDLHAELLRLAEPGTDFQVDQNIIHFLADAAADLPANAHNFYLQILFT